MLQDPVADWLGLGEGSTDTSRLLQLQVNTNQQPSISAFRVQGLYWE